MRKLAEAIERRNLVPLQGLSETAYLLMSPLYEISKEFTLPGDWNRLVNEMWNEFQYLRELAAEILRKK